MRHWKQIADNTFSEPVELVGEGEYNLNVLKEIKVTESYLGLDKDIRNCQNYESLFKCGTKQYIETFLAECGCLPFNIRLTDKVVVILLIFYSKLKNSGPNLLCNGTEMYK